MRDNAKKIGLASDHGGFSLKKVINEYLEKRGYEVVDVGTHTGESVDYPDVANALALKIEDQSVPRGIALCGTGIGISIALNRHFDVRAALCHDVTTTRLTREHNDANVLVMGARVVGPEVALDCVHIFLSTPYDGAPRHAQRVAKLGKPVR